MVVIAKEVGKVSLNLCRNAATSHRTGIFTVPAPESQMPKAARTVVQVPASTASSEPSDTGALVTVALFSAVGLLVSLVAILLGVPIAWY